MRQNGYGHDVELLIISHHLHVFSFLREVSANSKDKSYHPNNTHSPLQHNNSHNVRGDFWA